MVYRCAKVLTADELKAFCARVNNWKKRDCYAQLESFIYNSDSSDQVCVLHGLRRTGKTTMMRQAISAMPKEDFEKTCFILLEGNETPQDLFHDIDVLMNKNIRYFFIDEITLLKVENNFPAVIKRLADYYSQLGAHIVLSGTDSLMFTLAGADCFGRMQLIHTGDIRFKEFANLLNDPDLDSYIRYGATLVEEGINCKPNYKESPFSSSELLFNDYLNSAISRNILHGIQKCNAASRFIALKPLLRNNDLLEVINRIVAFIHTEPICKSLVYFFSRKSPIQQREIIDKITKHPSVAIIERVVENHLNRNYTADFKNDSDNQLFATILSDYYNRFAIKQNRLPKITDEQFMLLEQFLMAIGVIKKIAHRSIYLTQSNNNKGETGLSITGRDKTDKIICVQPGMRYSFTQELYRAINENIIMSDGNEQDYIDTLMSQTKKESLGHILEDIIINETGMAVLNWNHTLNQQKTDEAFQPLFNVFKQTVRVTIPKTKESRHKIMNKEIDMVVYDPLAEGYRLFEIKHNVKSDEDAERHLISPEVTYAIESQYRKPILSRTVLYRGDDEFVRTINGVAVEYRNAEKYLTQLDYEKIQSGIIPPYELSPERSELPQQATENEVAYNSENDEQEGRPISKRNMNILDCGL